MRILAILAGLLVLTTGCKPRISDSRVKDVQLTSLSERKNYVVFQDDSNLINVRECPPNAVAGKVAENVVVPPNCKQVNAEFLSRAQCSVPVNADPIPVDLYTNQLLHSMNLQNMEGTMKDLGSQRIELTAMEKNLQKLDAILVRKPSSELGTEAEKSRATVKDLRASVAILEAEVSRNSGQLKIYNQIVASLKCEESMQFFKGESEYSQILSPFENKASPAIVKKNLNQLLKENVPLGQTTTIDVNDFGRVAAISVQIDMDHEYPGEVGIEITSPDGKKANIPTLWTTVANKQVQIGVINKTYLPEMLALTGAQIKGLWTIRYGDRGSDTGTVNAISLTLHRLSPGLIDAVVADALTLNDWKVPKEAVLTLPILILRDQIIDELEFALEAEGSQDLEISLGNPGGKFALLKKTGGAYSLDAATAAQFKANKTGGLWLLKVNNKDKTTDAVIKNQKLQINKSRNIPAAVPPVTGGNTNGTGTTAKPGGGGSGVTIADVTGAITSHTQTKFVTYNTGGGPGACKSSGAGANPAWTQVMQDYYCTIPGEKNDPNTDIRACFTGSAGPCANALPASPRPMVDVKACYRAAFTKCAGLIGALQEDQIFQAVMVDRQF